MEFLFETQATPAEKTAIQQSFSEWLKQNTGVVSAHDLQIVAGANKIANCSFNGAMNSVSIRSIYKTPEAPSPKAEAKKAAKPKAPKAEVKKVVIKAKK